MVDGDERMTASSQVRAAAWRQLGGFNDRWRRANEASTQMRAAAWRQLGGLNDACGRVDGGVVSGVRCCVAAAEGLTDEEGSRKVAVPLSNWEGSATIETKVGRLSKLLRGFSHNEPKGGRFSRATEGIQQQRAERRSSQLLLRGFSVGTGLAARAMAIGDRVLYGGGASRDSRTRVGTTMAARWRQISKRGDAHGRSVREKQPAFVHTPPPRNGKIARSTSRSECRRLKQRYDPRRL